MKYIIKNKTTKNIVLLVDGKTKFLYPKGDRRQRDQILVDEVTSQMKNAKQLRFIQITKVNK